MVRAFEQGAEFAEPWENAQTMAAGIRVPSGIGDYLILRAVRESAGGALTVSDDEIRDYMGRVARDWKGCSCVLKERQRQRR